MAEPNTRKPNDLPPRRALFGPTGKSRRPPPQPELVPDESEVLTLIARLRKQLQTCNATDNGGEPARKIRENIESLIPQAEQIEDDAAEVVNWPNWIRWPDRRLLFDQLCRWVTPAEWEAAASGKLPRVFRSCPDEFPEHMGYCAHCRLQRLLAEIRVRRAKYAKPLLGDQQVEQFLHDRCREALYAAQRPAAAAVMNVRASGDTLVLLGVTGNQVRVKVVSLSKQVQLQVIADFDRAGGEKRFGQQVFPVGDESDLVLVGEEVCITLPSELAPAHVNFHHTTHPVELALPANAITAPKSVTNVEYGIGTVEVEWTGV